MYCLKCCKKVKPMTQVCPHCGYVLIPEKYRSLSTGSVEAPKGKKGKKVTKPIFTEEEAFMMHIHPDDELYRKIMEMNILSKKY